MKKTKSISTTTPAVSSDLDPKKFIIIKGARVHNLKNISVAIPRNKLVVITGLSGSGKSSLAFDTLFAEGQRRYVESLSSYARQFLGRLDKPEVDSITGISPAVAIEQKVISRTSRSTVGTSTEIYDYLKLLFSRVGKTYSPISGQEVKRDRAHDVKEYILAAEHGTRFYLLAPIAKLKGTDTPKRLDMLSQQGFSRVKLKNEILLIEEALQKAKANDPIWVVVDRLSADADEENQSRIGDSVESAFFEGGGECCIEQADTGTSRTFSNRFEADGLTFEEPSVNLFSFNNPVGACKSCEGFGSIIGIDENLVVPDKRLSIFQEAIACWRGEKMSEWKDQLVMRARKFDFPIHKPWSALTDEQRDLVWKGNEHFSGLNAFFQFVESESYKIQYRVMLSRYRGKTKCPDCKGTRLRKDANYVKIAQRSITDLVTAPISEVLHFFEQLSLSEHDLKIANRLLIEIKNRLSYLSDVGLHYLTLNRLSNTLSGGESQRINLATSLGSSLVGSIYILDEPSIGLHPRDTQRLIHVLQQLKQQGNTVIVVEHDEEMMRASDFIIDMGPEAGSFGGEVTFTGTSEELLATGTTLTADYLTGRKTIEQRPVPKKLRNKITVHGARENNLKNITVEFPLQCFTVVSGVSGSGKSTLIRDILYPALKKSILHTAEATGEFDAIDGDFSIVRSVEFIDQNPIGKSSRSNPITYVKAFDEIRTLYSVQGLAKQRMYKPSHFSFNVEGGRCDACEGEGFQTIEMQFMADIKLLCESCKGKRFKDEVLEVLYRGKSISDVLEMTVDDAVAFFAADATNTTVKNLLQKLHPLQQVGLGYIGLGQSSSSLSGGEAQRIKLASFLTKGQTDQHTIFIFDEPTTGLHFHDVKKLMESFRALLDRGHTIIAIEHNMDVMKCADWLIELGPDGGNAGGHLMYTGVPEGIGKIKNSPTGAFFAGKKSQK